jgi:hypothetical protein
MAIVSLLLALTPIVAQGRPAAAPPTMPPNVLNVVHHKLKRGTTAAYQTLEASIVAAYKRAKVPSFFWMTFQSTKDSRDVLYLNVAETTEQFNHLGEVWPSVAAAHPDLVRLQTRLAAMIEGQSSTLTRRREEIAYTRGDVDVATMRAVQLFTFHVKPGHEGRFMEGIRAAAAGGAPWIVYEANEESTFVLVMPLRSRTEARRAATIPRAIRELRGAVYRRAETELFLFTPAMSRPPAEFTAARARGAGGRSPSARRVENPPPALRH